MIDTLKGGITVVVSQRNYATIEVVNNQTSFLKYETQLFRSTSRRFRFLNKVILKKENKNAWKEKDGCCCFIVSVNLCALKVLEDCETVIKL